MPEGEDSSVGATLDVKSEGCLISPGIEFAIKSAAAFFAFVYGIGFLIVSIHHAQFQIPQFDPVKPKILSAGLVFVVLVSLTAEGALHFFGLLGVGAVPPDWALGILATATRRSKLVFLGSNWYFACYLSAQLVGLVYGAFPDPSPPGLTVYRFLLGALIVLNFAAGPVLRSRLEKFPSYPRVLAGLILVNVVGLMVVVGIYDDQRKFRLSLWFYAIGLLALLVRRVVRKPLLRRQVSWQVGAMMFAAVVFPYATLIYKDIPPEFGGGVPTPVTIYFASATPVFHDAAASVQLLEETAEGYYVLVPPDEKHAYFLKRDLVSAIRFGTSPSTLK